MNPIDTHIKEAFQTRDKHLDEDIMKHLIKDTRKRTARRNELHPMTKLAILAGAVALLSVLYYIGVVTDAIIGLMLI